MTVDEMVDKYAQNKSEEDWIQRMVSMAMVMKKHTYLESISEKNNQLKTE